MSTLGAEKDDLWQFSGSHFAAPAKGLFQAIGYFAYMDTSATAYSLQRPFESNHNADVAQDGIEFDTPEVISLLRVPHK